MAGLAAVALPYGLSVDIEPFRTPPTVKNTTSGRVYFRSGSERPPNAFFGRFGRRGLALGDIRGVYETGSRILVSVVIHHDAWLYTFS